MGYIRKSYGYDLNDILLYNKKNNINWYCRKNKFRIKELASTYQHVTKWDIQKYIDFLSIINYSYVLHL